jgi:hypothetical protein
MACNSSSAYKPLGLSSSITVVFVRPAEALTCHIDNAGVRPALFILKVMKNNVGRLVCNILVGVIFALFIFFVLYLLFTGQGQLFHIGEFLIQTNPYNWATLGIGLCISISVLGAAWYISLTNLLLKGNVYNRIYVTWSSCQGP